MRNFWSRPIFALTVLLVTVLGCVSEETRALKSTYPARHGDIAVVVVAAWYTYPCALGDAV